MSLFRRTFDRMVVAREREARRYVEAYLRGADKDLLAANGFDADRMKAQDPKYLPF